jgi:histidine ammonia-lyase
MTSPSITIEPGRLTLAELRAWQQPVTMSLAAGANTAIAASAAAIQRIVARGAPAYGINTGFGLLAKTRIPDDQLQQLQRNLILSHSVGTGPLLDDAIVRLALALKVGSLARGHSGRAAGDHRHADRDRERRDPAAHSGCRDRSALPATSRRSHMTLALLGEARCACRGARSPRATRWHRPVSRRSCSARRKGSR